MTENPPTGTETATVEEPSTSEGAPAGRWGGVLLTVIVVPLLAFPFFRWFLLPITIGSHGRRGMNLGSESLDALASPEGQAVLFGTSVVLTVLVTAISAIAMFRDPGTKRDASNEAL